MAATDPRDSGAATPEATPPERGKVGGVLLAALALPGLGAPAVYADSAPEHATIAYKQLHYQDSQSGLQRIHVDAPSLYLMTPIGANWSLAGSAVLDVVSGASPRYYTSVSGASHMFDRRIAEDAKVTYYRSRSQFSFSASHSKEDDYESNAFAADASFSTEDNNTTFNFGAGASIDTINPVNHIVVDAHKHTREFLAGVTQALDPFDLVQLQLGYSIGNGYYDDPYKLFDNRPGKHDQGTAVLRWNHQFEDWGSTLRTNYRYYRDSNQVHAHTIQLEWVQPLGESFSVSPSLSYYTQSAASFYIDPPNGDQNRFPNIPPGSYSSLDQRVSAFGGITAGGRVDWIISPHWSTNLKGDYHEERAAWRLFGQGSPGLVPFRYVAFEFGLSYRF
ncbi:DUF3570 domain-containing protein [Nevskia soli]|uniref:DUF3570 domain-containing protein n=1 Tax=Nevskia soli TaxID=418856 RepID=UPI00068A29B6|nr:DUF3570 domain-containing protein [Nevskia soli]